MRAIARVLLPTLVALVLVGCVRAGGGQVPGSPAASPSPSAPSAVDGGGSAPDPGSGVTSPPQPSGEPSPVEPNPTLVFPRPGRLDVHPAGASTIEARVDGRDVTVKLTWWSGVEPCSALDSVAIERADDRFHLTILEGADQRGVACIEIAMLKATLVDLGQLAPGTYTISAEGQAPPVVVTVH